jgi:hypothetical protein
MRLAYALTVGFFVVVVAVASYLRFSGGDDVQPASKTAAAERKPVKVVIAGTNDAKEEVVDCGIVGEGTFRATGGIADSGPVRAYRCVPNDNLIVFRYVANGKNGTIAYHVAIDIERLPPVSHWKIESATRAYRGLHGEGNESENATYTVTYLKGSVWR